MGMFDRYRPDPPLYCPRCSTELSGWQGKDGPCALFLWQQGEKNPVDQSVGDDIKIDPVARSQFTLPETFEIHTSCSQCEKLVKAHCQGDNYVWTQSVVSGGKRPPNRNESMGDYQSILMLEQLIQCVTINKDNLESVNWEEGCFKFCSFESFHTYVSNIDSDFIDCIFTDLDWYGALFNVVSFIGCKFDKCTFRGAGFPDCKFVECEFKNCQFIEDNIGGDCYFDNARVYNCKFIDCVGFDLSKKCE